MENEANYEKRPHVQKIMDEAKKQKVESLKENWLKDPCWNIENTEGFEEFYDELRLFRLKQEIRWKNEYRLKCIRKSVDLGFFPNEQIGEYIINLENRLKNLEEKVNNL